MCGFIGKVKNLAGRAENSWVLDFRRSGRKFGPTPLETNGSEMKMRKAGKQEKMSQIQPSALMGNPFIF